MSTPATQHTFNALPVVATFGSIVSHLPEAITVLVGLASLFYYWLVISEKLEQRKAQRDQIKQSATRVAVPILEERHGPSSD